MISLPDDFVVTPWEVSGDIDYDELVARFGTSKIDAELLDRFKKHTGELHLMLKRGIFYSHRDMNWIFDMYEKGEGFALYTGRGPSGHTTLGHMMPWIFTKYLQDKFGVNLYFELTDDEKFYFKENLTLEEAKSFAYENALDLIALGFDPEKTSIFLDTEFIHNLYPTAAKVAKKVNFSTIKAVFGFTNSNNIGSIFYTSLQGASAFVASDIAGRNVPCLIPCGIDQDPHFRICRDVAEKIGYYKPAGIYCKMLPSLAGSDKMSASLPSTSIFTTDSPGEIKKKIGNAFTGGAVSVEEQRKDGGKPDICSVYQYLYYLFEDDDKKLEERRQRCLAGEILCGECKQHLTALVIDFLTAHQEKREKARDIIEDFMLRD